MDVQITRITVTTSGETDGLSTFSANDPRLPLSYREREHTSTIASPIDFSRPGSMDAPAREEPQVPQAMPADSPSTLPTSIPS